MVKFKKNKSYVPELSPGLPIARRDDNRDETLVSRSSHTPKEQEPEEYVAMPVSQGKG